LTRLGIREQQRGKIRCCQPHPLERGLYRAMEMTFWLPQTEAVLSQVEEE
jgi:hypothetical protein